MGASGQLNPAPALFRAGGTSVASPIIAAYYALLGDGVGNGGASWAYGNASLLNDVVSGSDGSCTTLYWCSATTGYDGPSGVGSISGDAIAGPPQVGGAYSSAVTDTTATLQGGAYTNQHDTQAFWQYGPTNSYGQSTPAVDLGSQPGVTPISTPVSGLTGNTTYHYRLVATNCAGTNYGYDALLNTAAPATTTTTTSTTTDSSATSTASATPCAETSSTSSTSSSTATATVPPTTLATTGTVTATATAQVPSSATVTTTTHTTTHTTTQTTHTTTAVAAFAVAVSASAPHRGNQVRVTVRCNRQCAGSITLRIKGKVIGQAQLALHNRGFTGVAVITLNAHGRQVLKGRHRVAAVASLALNGHGVQRNVLIG